MRRPRGDDGASLLIVLVFMLLISAVTIGLLGFTEASFQGTSAVRESRSDTYAVDSATEFAIQKVVKDPTGDLGTTFGPSCSYVLTGINGRSVSTTCRALAGFGAQHPNKPINALLTLSTTSPLTLTGNEDLLVDGRVYSNQGILTGQPDNSLESTATVTAEGNADCTTAKVIAVKGKSCDAASTAAGDDPAWAPATSTRPGTVLATSVTYDCTAPGNGNGNGGGNGGGNGNASFKARVSFPPGTHTGVTWTAALAAADLAGCGADSLLHFQPGIHYLEDLVLSVGGHSLVAGTPKGNWLTNKTAPPTDGTACDNSAAGARFILGGSSSLRAVDTNAVPTITVCAGPTPAATPAIALHGLKSAVGSMKALTSTVALETADKPFVFMHGTVYLPTSAAHITLHNKAQTSFDRGIVVDSLVAAISASSKQTGAAISLPACTEADPCRTDRRVAFTSTASGGGATLSSVVQFDDDRGGAPAKSSALIQWSRVE